MRKVCLVLFLGIGILALWIFFPIIFKYWVLHVLVTPPFTQLNTPYPATAYLKGFLNTKGITSFQSDLGIEVILQLFSKTGLTELFSRITNDASHSDNAKRILALQHEYINSIDVCLIQKAQLDTQRKIG